MRTTEQLIKIARLHILKDCPVPTDIIAQLESRGILTNDIAIYDNNEELINNGY